MKDFKLNDIKKLVEQSLKEEPMGDAWLDSRYNEQVWYTGHTQPYYRLFYYIAQQLRPGFSVELGSWQATAAAHLAMGNPTGWVITIDIHREDLKAKERAEEAAAHLPNLVYINKWTWDAVHDVKAPGKAIDILFVDAWHDYQYVTKEWELYEPLLADVALVICDDILPDDPSIGEGMVRWWGEITEGREAFLDARPHPGIPMGFMKYERGSNAPDVAEDRRAGEPVQSAAGGKAGRPAKQVSRKRKA
jgi:predicted O-methyltransferase YrrM